MKYGIYTPLKANPNVVGSEYLCVFAALISGFGSVLVMILSSNLLSHDSVSWLSICIFTWILSIITWFIITLLVMHDDRPIKMRVGFALFYILAVTISLSIVSAKLKIIGNEAFNDGLFPLKELDWSFSICMLLGALCLCVSNCGAKKVDDTAGSESQQSRYYGGC
ncbi:MAG: hypothetical protein Q9197_002930 [Variospora fuerteventurae]